MLTVESNRIESLSFLHCIESYRIVIVFTLYRIVIVFTLYRIVSNRSVLKTYRF